MSSSLANKDASLEIRDFKIQRRNGNENGQRERQREHLKNNRFHKQNNNFASASSFFAHFFTVLALLRRENT